MFNSLEYFVDCPVCKTLAKKVVHEIPTGYLVRCQLCKLVIYAPQPTHEFLQTYYNSPKYRKEYEEIGMTKNEFAENRYQQFLRMLAKHKKDFFKPFESKLLDVGCGNGDFLYEAQKKCWKVNGVEISPVAAHKANLNLMNNCVFTGRIEELDLPNNYYDVITSFHVIEHLLDPILFLSRIRALLKPGGVLFLETPNIASLGAKLRGANWSHIIPPEHIIYFNPISLSYALNKSGFSSVNTFTIRPQKIKSMENYPVSIRKISEYIYTIAPFFNLGAGLQAVAFK